MSLYAETIPGNLYMKWFSSCVQERQTGDLEGNRDLILDAFVLINFYNRYYIFNNFKTRRFCFAWMGNILPV